MVTPRNGVVSIALAILTTLSGFGGPTVASAQERPQNENAIGAAGETDRKAELERRRERLRKMSPEERSRLEENLRRLRGLSREKQDELRRKHRALQDLRHRILLEMPHDERSRLEALPAEDFDREMTRRIERRRKNEERRFVRALPEKDRDRIEQAKGAERRRLLGRLRERARMRIDAKWLDSAVKRGKVDAEKADKLRALRPKERIRRIDALRESIIDQSDRKMLDRWRKRGEVSEAESRRILRTRGFERRALIARLRVERYLENPPDAYEQLPQAERDRLREAPPHRFFGMLRRALESRGEDTADPEPDVSDG